LFPLHTAFRDWQKCLSKPSSGAASFVTVAWLPPSARSAPRVNSESRASRSGFERLVRQRRTEVNGSGDRIPAVPLKPRCAPMPAGMIAGYALDAVVEMEI
jgi:hypothetical protein